MTRSPLSKPGKRGQRGISLVVGLIMLVLMTLLAMSAFEAGNVNLRIAGNMQARQETLAAAQTALEQVLSSPAFIDPATPPASATVDLNGESFTVHFTPPPACTTIVDLPSEELVPSNPDDFVCIPSGAVPGSASGIFRTGSPPSAPSYCSNTRWAVVASVADAKSGAHTAVEQGVAVRMSKAGALAACP